MAQARKAGIVLAAGTSSRFASSVPKQLQLWEEEPLVRRTAKTLLDSHLDEVWVVVGHRALEVRAAVEDLPVRVAVNPLFERGQSTSIRAGLLALDPNIGAALFCPCDQPFLTSELIDLLLDRFTATQASIVRPMFGDRPGAPVLWEQSCFDALKSLRGDQGGRVLMKSAPSIEAVELDRLEPLLDIDTVEDWNRLARSRGT